MIYLIQNVREYDYDVRAIALAFYERTKIVEVTKEEFDEEWDKAKPENKTINSAVHGDERCFFTGNDNEIYYYEHWDEIITDMYERGDYMNY